MTDVCNNTCTQIVNESEPPKVTLKLLSMLGSVTNGQIVKINITILYLP